MGSWHIRDFGRGLRYSHLTQNENLEKLKHPECIGKFGVGLKDALATLFRKHIHVLIKSRHGDVTLGFRGKHGFDLKTLHAIIRPPSSPDFSGTEFVLKGVSDEEMAKAKDFFLRFTGDTPMETTRYGSVLMNQSSPGHLYINGVKVAEEENFLFSYNITSITKTIKEALNRERTNVGRAAYSDRVKAILLACRSEEVGRCLMNDLKEFSTGRIHDELKWLDVQEHAVKILNTKGKALFLTSEEMMASPFIVKEANESGLEIVQVPDSVRNRIQGAKDLAGGTIRDLHEFQREYSESFQFKFVDLADLTPAELTIFRQTNEILSFIGGKPKQVSSILISETMKKSFSTVRDAKGVWEKPRIIIRRSQLRTLIQYAATLLHEVSHATSGAGDVTEEFEQALTATLGLVASHAAKRRLEDPDRSINDDSRRTSRRIGRGRKAKQ